MIRKKKNDRSSNRHQQSSLWTRCTSLRALRQVHAFIVVNGFNSRLSYLRELIFASAMTISGTIDYAHELFDHIIEPDLFIWNTMIRGSAQSSTPLNAISLYSQMERTFLKPDNFTFPFVLKACTRLSWPNMGNQVHGQVVKFGFESNIFVRNTLIHFHANCGNLSVARDLFDDSAKRDIVAWSALTAGYARRGQLSIARCLFDEMPAKDLVSWNVMITGYAKLGQMDNAKELFDEVPKRDVVTWNTMIAGYVLSGSHKQALEMFDEMRCAGFIPDEVTMLSLLSACAELGDLDIGQRIYSSFSNINMMDLSIVIKNALIDMYAKCGSIDRAREVFNNMREKDVSTWNTIMGGLALHGHAEESIYLFTVMRRLKFQPDVITFVAVLVACSHAGQVEEGRKYFNLMKNEYKIKPNMRHYGCMVDMLGRAGLLNDAFEFLETMDIEANAVIWRTLLGSCRVHGNVDLARRANEELLKLRNDQSGDYVLLSNVYASIGEWDGVEKVRKLMDDSGVRKEPGCSFVEADEKELMHFLFDSKPMLITEHG